MDNQEEIQHGCPGVLGFIFYNGQPMNPHGELDFFFFLRTTKNSKVDVSQYSVRYEYLLWARPAKARR